MFHVVLLFASTPVDLIVSLNDPILPIIIKWIIHMDLLYELSYDFI